MFFRVFLFVISIGIVKGAEVFDGSKLLLSLAGKKAAIPTKAYLSQPALRGMVFKTWHKQLKSHRIMIEDIVTREEKFADTHHVFYHAQQSRLMVWQDFLKVLYEHIHNKKINDFVFVRKWHTALEKTDAKSFIKDSGFLAYDREPHLRPLLLSVNLSLFGNTERIKERECSFDYFINDYNICAPDETFLLHVMTDDFKFSSKAQDRLHDFSAKHGVPSILQIFVPKEHVDKAVYISAAVGYPLSSGKTMLSDDVLSTSTMLEDYRHAAYGSEIFLRLRNFLFTKSYHLNAEKISKIDTEMSMSSFYDRLQARILIGDDIMLNPKSGVKIFRHTAMTDVEKRVYKKKLQELSSHIFIDSL